QAAMQAASHAKVAASRARSVAGHTAATAYTLSATAQGGKTRADREVVQAEQAERDARDRIHEADGPARSKETA
ncbi:MAG: hypothetical protein M3452_10315, partial [Chloroflexota bacterium]|nr:hypothetical protein [Chloroflexota bacterium]